MDCSSLALSLFRYHNSSEWKSGEKIDFKANSKNRIYFETLFKVFRYLLAKLLFMFETLLTSINYNKQSTKYSGAY